ncbi:MAG: GlsB/YeaQ/YmgE family stress response membrane protein [Longimicrobiales bacterium]
MPGKDPGGCLLTIVIGIIGALIGGVLGTRVFGVGPVTGFNLQSLGLAILGAVLLLMVFRLLIAKRPDR